MSDGRPRGISEPGASVSVILAVLNERENLPHVIPRILAQGFPNLEVIVIDDGSTDGTREYLREIGSRDPRVRAVFHDGKQTTLRAQCQGIAAARGEFIVVMDADLQHPPESLPAMMRVLEGGAALVVASRYAPGGSPGVRTPYRILLSRGAEWIAKAWLPSTRRVSDPVSGYFGFRREIWHPLDPESRGYKLLLFVLAMAEGRRLGEVGFRFEARTRGDSKVTESVAFVRLFLAEIFLARRFARGMRRNATRTGIAPPPAQHHRS